MLIEILFETKWMTWEHDDIFEKKIMKVIVIATFLTTGTVVDDSHYVCCLLKEGTYEHMNIYWQ